MKLRPVVLGAAVVLTVAAAVRWPAGALPAPWIALLLGAAAFVALGAVEPALVVLLSAAAGALWARAVAGADVPAYAPAAAWIVGTAIGVLLARARLARFRGEEARPLALRCAVAASAGSAVVLAAIRSPWTLFVALPPLSALVLGAAGMDVLLFRDNRRGAPRLPWLLGGAYALVHVVVAQLLLVFAALPLALLPGDARPRLRRLGRLGIRSLFRVFPYGRLEMTGVEPAAFERPAILVSNHQSAVDILLVLALPGDVRLTLSPRVWRTPTLGIAARSLGHILVDSAERTVETCKERLRENALVHFFPEGTRSEDAFPARFHPGAFEIAVALGCDVLPVVLCDTRTCVPRDAFWVEPFRMSVRVLPRVTPRDFDYTLGSAPLRKHVLGAVRAAFLEEHGRLHTPDVLRRRVARLYRYQGFATARAVRRELAAGRWLEPLGEIFPARGHVLDLGCGLGITSHWLAERHPQLAVKGVDADAELIRVARRSATGSPRVTFVHGPVEEAEGPADGAVLRVGAARDLEETLRRLFDALRPGAPLVLPDLHDAQRAAVAAAGFLPKGTAYVRGGTSA